jgi:hypothetical protein
MQPQRTPHRWWTGTAQRGKIYDDIIDLRALA